jgi:hypothetical protein
MPGTSPAAARCALRTHRRRTGMFFRQHAAEHHHQMHQSFRQSTIRPLGRISCSGTD